MTFWIIDTKYFSGWWIVFVCLANVNCDNIRKNEWKKSIKMNWIFSSQFKFSVTKAIKNNTFNGNVTVQNIVTILPNNCENDFIKKWQICPCSWWIDDKRFKLLDLNRINWRFDNGIDIRFNKLLINFSCIELNDMNIKIFNVDNPSINCNREIPLCTMITI